MEISCTGQRLRAPSNRLAAPLQRPSLTKSSRVKLGNPARSLRPAAAYNGAPQQHHHQQPAAVHAVVPAWQQPQQQHGWPWLEQAPQPRSFFGFWLPVLMVFCLTLMSFAASLFAFVLYIRPLLKAAERAAAAAETAAVQMEAAAREMEKAAAVMSSDLPVTFLEMEKASREFETLGRQVNTFMRALVRQPAEAVQSAGSTMAQSTRKVVDDVSSLSSLTSARSWVSKWRSRTASATSSDEAAAGSLPPSPPPAPQDGATLRSQWRISSPWEKPSKKKEAQAAPSAAADATEPGGWQEAVQQLKAEEEAERAGQASNEPGSRGASSAVAEFGNTAAAMKAAVVAQLKARGGSKEERAAAVAVLAALDRAQEAAREAASATGALEAALDRVESKGSLWGKR